MVRAINMRPSKCTFGVTGCAYGLQPWYHCTTCELDNTLGMCYANGALMCNLCLCGCTYACACTCSCFLKHKRIRTHAHAYCWIVKLVQETIHLNARCLFARVLNSVNNWYFPLIFKGCCKACVEKCHAGHVVKPHAAAAELNCYCDCGAGVRGPCKCL